MNYMMLPGLKYGINYPHIRNQEYVIKLVCDYFETNMDELRKKCRKRKLVQTRYILSYYLYHRTGMTYNDIAEIFKPAIKDHSTVIHGVNMIREQLSIPIDTEINLHCKNIGL